MTSIRQPTQPLLKDVVELKIQSDDGYKSCNQRSYFVSAVIGFVFGITIQTFGIGTAQLMLLYLFTFYHHGPSDVFIILMLTLLQACFGTGLFVLALRQYKQIFGLEQQQQHQQVHTKESSSSESDVDTNKNSYFIEEENFFTAGSLVGIFLSITITIGENYWYYYVATSIGFVLFCCIGIVLRYSKQNASNRTKAIVSSDDVDLMIHDKYIALV